VELFASGDNSGLIGFLFIIGGIGYLGYRAYVFFYRPQVARQLYGGEKMGTRTHFSASANAPASRHAANFGRPLFAAFFIIAG
jgi:hypothetical protein